MPWSLTDNIVHWNSGGVSTSSTSTAITVSLAGSDTTEADNFVVVMMTGYWAGSGQSLTLTVPSGWATLSMDGASSLPILYRGPEQGLAAGESSWNFTPATTSTGEVTWQVFELSNILTADPVEVAFSGSYDAGTGTVKSSTSGKTNSYDAIVFGAHAFHDRDNATPPTWGSHTNSFTEIGESGQAGTGHSIAMSVSALQVSVPNTYTVAATASRTYAANEAFSCTFVLTAANAPRQTDLGQMDGGESREVGTATAGVTLDPAAARSGAVGYRLSSTAAACNKTLPGGTPNGNATTAAIGLYPTHRFHIRLDDLADKAQIFYFTLSWTGGTAVLTGRLTGGQIGLNWASGATSGGEQLSDVITADQWIGVEVRIDRRSGLSSSMKVDWWVDYNAELTDTTPAVQQTQVTNSTGPSGTFIGLTPRMGWSSALTAAMDVDDYGQAPGYQAPIGDLRVLPLKVDPAGTPSITGTGTTSNFGVMTANGTVAAWNATNARNAVDDIPPIAAGNASRDAAVAILAHASDNASFPAETYGLAANKVNVRGVKVHWWLWAASTTATTIRIFVSDGVTTYTVFAEANPSAGPTTMVYGSGVVRAGAAIPPDWSQAKVDALAFLFGSNDANPDVGVDAWLIEMAVVKAQVETLFGESPDLYIEAARDPATQALVGMTVNTPAGQPATVDYEISGTPGSTGSIAGGSSQYVPLSADGSIETVNKIQLTPG